MDDYNAAAINNSGMDWGDSIETDGPEAPRRLEGDYNFTVTRFERGRFPGSAKMPPCNKAELTLEVETEDGPVNVRMDLILNRLVEFRISAFFRSIGQKKPGERLAMDWSKVTGSRGRAHFAPRTYIDRNGRERWANNVEYFIDYDEKNFRQEATSDDDDILFS